jgi:hypothetical protein
MATDKSSGWFDCALLFAKNAGFIEALRST